MARGPGFCPGCGERVSPFAAGCTLCGADLDPRRHQTNRRRWSLPRLSSASTSAAQRDLLLVLVLVLFAVFAPLIGALLGAYIAFDANRNGRIGIRNTSLAIVAVSVLLLANPLLQFDLLRRIGLI